jgi:hypothetical protein
MPKRCSPVSQTTSIPGTPYGTVTIEILGSILRPGAICFYWDLPTPPFQLWTGPYYKKTIFSILSCSGNIVGIETTADITGDIRITIPGIQNIRQLGTGEWDDCPEGVVSLPLNCIFCIS